MIMAATEVERDRALKAGVSEDVYAAKKHDPADDPKVWQVLGIGSLNACWKACNEDSTRFVPESTEPVEKQDDP